MEGVLVMDDISKAKQNKRYLYIDALKVFACFQVILLHSFHIFDDSQVYKVGFLARTFYLIQCAVPIFFTITGVTLIRKNYKESLYLKKIFVKTIKIITYLLVFQFPFFVYKNVIQHQGLPIIWYLQETLKVNCIEPANWFWKPYIALLFMSPILSAILINLNRKDLIVFYIILLLQRIGIGLLPDISYYFPYIYKNEAITFTYYVFYMVSGFLIHNQKFNTKIVLIYIIIYAILSKMAFNDLLFTEVKTIATVLLFKLIEEKGWFKVIKDYIIKISNLTLGIYMIHMYVYNVIRLMILKYCDAKNFSNVLIAYGVAFATFIISAIIIMGIRKIEAVRKWMS